jgi:hypothetical protein
MLQIVVAEKPQLIGWEWNLEPFDMWFGQARKRVAPDTE